MSEIKWALEPSDIEWTMPWGEYGKPEKGNEPQFEEANALAHLLMNDVIFLNSHWFEKSWPKEAKETVALCVNCNDVFAWGCADAEGLPYGELENLYRMWRKDPSWGPAVWCMIRRNQMPQPPVEKAIRAAGIWDFDALGLGKNRQDAEVKAMIANLERP